MRYIHNEKLFLLFGDVLVFYLSLWLTLTLREFQLPSKDIWLQHAVPFSLFFILSVLVYFIAGLYDQHTSLLRSKLPYLVAYSQTITVVLAALFFFSVPYFGITPKTILVIFLAVSSALILLWRLFLVRYVGVRTQTGALILGSGKEIDELTQELEINARYGLRVGHVFAPEDVEYSEKLQEQMLEFITEEKITVVIVDTRDPAMVPLTPILYNLLFLHPQLTIVDASQLYEDIFRRIPISLLQDSWFIAHVTRKPFFAYNLFHRFFDIVLSLVLGVVTLVLFPFVVVAIKLEDGGDIFSFQRRVGKDNQPLDLVKFRTMTNASDGGVLVDSEKVVTRVGHFLRVTRIDELPQLWNVLFGQYSLIGPRPEFGDAVSKYASEIPYYNARHLITPGLSGWAQLNHEKHPHHGVDIEETRNKLSYDLYYLKNRSLFLDLEIGLKTIKTLLSAAGK
jgi:lipopolysaccharide/colanic/teichoic acid biosynthesis glycosyltransferase